MTDRFDIYAEQLKKTCKVAGARWAVLVEEPFRGYDPILTWGINKSQREAVDGLLGDKAIQKWISSVQGSRAGKYRSLKENGKALRCERVYGFPAGDRSGVLLVGANELAKNERAFFLVLAMDAPERGRGMAILEFGVQTVPVGKDPALHLEDSLLRILEMTLEVILAEKSFLAIRSGDNFKVEAAIGIAEGVGTQIGLEGNKLIGRLIAAREGDIIPMGEGKSELPKRLIGGSKGNWMVVPVVLGSRVIGLTAYSQNERYTSSDLEKANILASHVAASIEKTIVFVEAANYLQRFALLNEIATAASAGGDFEEVAQRIRMLLRQSFEADRVSILLLDEIKNEFIEYERGEGTSRLQHLPVAASLAGAAINAGPVRIDNLDDHPDSGSENPEAVSVLAVPLRFRGKVVGVLSVESGSEGAFSEQDEQFLMVIANQIASMIENVRLNEETRHRAHNLLQINEIVQGVLGLNNIREISDRAAVMLAERFGYEMVLVMVLDDKLEELVAEGVAGSKAKDVPKGMRYARNLGIPGEVLGGGKSVLLRQAAEAPNYFAIPGWEPGTQMVVPLREGDNVFGVINVEYQTPDAADEDELLILEAIAGVLSSVLMNAERYQQLQTNIRQLEAVRETSLDLGTDLDLEILLKRVVNRVRELVDARGAELGLVEVGKDQVQVLVSENPWKDYTGYTFPFMLGVIGRVAAMGEPMAVADFNEWSGKAEGTFKAPFTTVAGVPLKLSGEVIGTLTVQDDRLTRAFGKEDIRTLELLAPQLAIFIRNARLYQELEDRVEAQRLAEERLVRSAKLAAVGEMAAAVAHELNNPLTTVTGFTELILETLPKDSPEFEDLSLVLQEAQRSRSVVRRLLDFSRQGEILRVESDVNEVISTVLALVHHLVGTSGIEIRVEMWDDPPSIRIDRNQMQQVFLNLIHNAIQAMPEGGDLVIQSQLDRREEGEWIAVHIKDNGVGIGEDHLERIFEPFFTTKPSGEGTGLGLSVSYGIVSEHGGHIDVISKVGEGSTFSVWIPVKAPNSAESEDGDA